MYSQDDKEFYTKTNAGDLDYGNLYSYIDPKYEFQIAYSVLHLQNIIHDEDKTIIDHLYDHGYSNEKVDELLSKAYKMDDIISDNYHQALFDINKNTFPYHRLSDFVDFPIDCDTTFKADKLLCALTLMKSKDIADISKADKFFAIDSCTYETAVMMESEEPYLIHKGERIDINNVIDMSNGVYSALKEKFSNDKSIEKFILENTDSVVKICSNILDKSAQIDKNFHYGDTRYYKAKREFINEISTKEISAIEEKLKKDSSLEKLKQNLHAADNLFVKEYTKVVNDKDLEKSSPIAKEIYAALRLEANFPLGVTKNMFKDFKQHKFALLAGNISIQLKEKYNDLLNPLEKVTAINKDLTENKEEFLKIIDKCIFIADKKGKIENLNEILQPVLEKKTPAITIEKYIEETSGKYSDRKITNDILNQSSKFSELKGKALSMQKKIISSAIKKVRALSNHLGR